MAEQLQFMKKRYIIFYIILSYFLKKDLSNSAFIGYLPNLPKGDLKVMDETQAALVLMWKNPENGFLEKEMGTYTLSEDAHGELIERSFVTEAENGDPVVTLFLGCGKDAQDWEYNALFDYYDEETLAPYVNSFAEEDGQFNPLWRVTLPFVEDAAKMTEKLNDVTAAHFREITSVWETISDKKDDYVEEN